MSSALKDKKHQIKLLNALYFAPKRFLREKKIIEEIFNNDKETTNRIIECIRGKYIIPHEEKGKGFELKQEGVDYLLRLEEKHEMDKKEKEILKIQQESSKREDKILTIQQETSKTNKNLFWIQGGTLAVLVLTLAAVGYSAYNAGISADAAERSANYSYLTYQATLDALIPNSADIILSRYDTDTIFSASDLTRGIPYDEFQICIKNRGRMDSSRIGLSGVNEPGYFPADEDIWNIEDVPSGEEKCRTIPIRHHKWRENIDESAIPTGNTTLKLRIFCPDCDKNKVQYHNISICIMNDTHPC